MDIYSRARRSALMGRVRAKDTGAEVAVRRALHSAGMRYRLHQPDLPGRPDIVLPRFRVVVLVHGCFWHHHRGCRKSTLPKTNAAFWDKKISDNVQRDSRTSGALRLAGWRVLIVWECQTKKPQLSERLVRLIRGTRNG